MSTHATIGYFNSDGSIDSIYVHSDGYAEVLGNMLTTFHSSDAAAKHIVDLGDASYISVKLDPVTSSHSFDDPEDECSVFYGRDRKEENVEAKHYQSLDDWLESACSYFSADFQYLWKDNKWSCWDYSGNSVNLYS